MTYRVALGPAGLGFGIPALADGVARMFGVDAAGISGWAARHVAAFDGETMRDTRDAAVPLPLIQSEIGAAVAAMAPKPGYLPLELVRHPRVIDIPPPPALALV